MKWFKEGKDEEAEFEFVVQRVDMLSEVQDKRTKGINIRLSLDTITLEAIDELADMNPLNRQHVALTSRSQAVRITPRFYKWLCMKRSENTLTFNVVTRE